MMRYKKHYTSTDDYKRAQELRHTSSSFEQKLWGLLRNHPHIKFRRQQPIHPYFADFACMQAKLIIEIDGPSHDKQEEYDQKRDAYLKKQGFTVLRFSNEDMKQNAENIAETIIAKAKGLIASPHPLTSKN